MKAINFLMGCAATCLLAGCADEWVVNDPSQQNEGTPLTIRASNGSDADTRLTFGDDGLTLLWENGDQLVLVDVNDKIAPIYLTTELDEPSSTAVFKSESGVPAGTYYVRNSSSTLYSNYEGWMTLSIKNSLPYSSGGSLNRIDNEYRLKDLTQIPDYYDIEVCGGPITIEDGQTSVEIKMQHVLTMLKFNITGGDFDWNNVEMNIGMACPEKPFPVEVWIDDSKKQERALPILEVTDDISRPTQDGLGKMGAFILPVDLSGQDVYFYVSVNKFSDQGMMVYEIKKTGKDLKPGICYTVDLDLTKASLMEITDGQLSTPEHFRALAYHPCSKNKYVITQDIDFSGETFFPISSYYGEFDGQGHALKNLNIDWPYDEAGLFSYCYNGKISNLTLENVTIEGTNYVGALVGNMDQSSILTNCKLTGVNSIKGTGDYVGGLVGGADNLAKINSCTVNNETTIQGCNAVGGVAGRIGIANDCFSAVTVNGANHVGGLAGYAENTLTNCGASASVTATGNYAGGLIGGSNYECEIIGHADGNLEKCYSTSNVKGKNYVGGVIGAGVSASINLCFSTGEVNGESYVGGIIGSGCTITNSYSLSDVTGTDNTTTAGITGNILGNGYLERCYSAGKVSSEYGISNQSYLVYTMGI